MFPLHKATCTGSGHGSNTGRAAQQEGTWWRWRRPRPAAVPRLASFCGHLVTALLCMGPWSAAGAATPAAPVQVSPVTASDVTLEAQGLQLLNGNRLTEALAAFQAALPLRLARLGADAAETAALLGHLGETQYHLGQTAMALVTFQQILAAVEGREGGGTPAAAVALASVGLLQLELEQWAGARTTLTTALAHLDALNPTGTVDTGVVLFGLGRLAVRQGDDVGALGFLRRALPLYEAALGPDAPEIAAVQETLGFTELRQQLILPARQHLGEALATVQRRYGQDAPAVGRLAGALALAYTDAPPGLQDHGRAMTYHRLFAQAFFAAQLAAFRNLDSAAKVQFNALARDQFTRYFEAVFIERMVDEAGSRPVVRAAFESWLTFKGSASALENGLSALLSRSDPALRARIRSYLDLRGELATLSTAPPLTVQDAARTAVRLAELRARLTALEQSLSGELGRFQDVLLAGRITLDQLQGVLRRGEVYLDYVWTDTNVFAYAYTWDGRFEVQWLPLMGKVAATYEALRRGAEAGLSEDALRPQATFLYDMLIRPLSSTFQGATSLIVSPDGPLNFLPFELLSDGRHSLLERFALRYVPSGRDLLRLRRRPAVAPTSPAAVFGNPAYWAVPQAQTPPPPETTGRGAVSGGGDPAGETAATLSEVLRGTVFAALPGTGTEAQTVSALLGNDTRVFLGADASDLQLFGLSSPRVLHIGTHGFFLQQAWERRALPNPMLRAGLALAGAQTAVSEGSGEGLLTGLQLAGLHLDGTDLVVLSACETGLGDAVAGEGVAGLNQAFLTAGAQRIVLSQWKVPDTQTAELMAAFYARYTRGTEAAEALRQAKLTMKRRGLPPRDWAAFLLSGG
ncbi:hypothetical protein GCM10010840_15960 [Deinococcus aerolatus]|uniref:CHAT domain-containing protein n=1 Tax=Deinococcus aerolatus TaxID=522487 RepID=A0ABQ2G709_9DEIO|nr:CHAT domain-containing tetratricopeptide repeat protein [Deinococcus aerolatus]GGL78928.1 hypothetical protein GCM10010840_15960 [Deinococcus aerolatus]